MAPSGDSVVRRPRSEGLSLLELLLALGVAVLLAALLFSVYHTVSATRLAQEKKRRGADAVAAAARRLVQDVLCAWLPPDDACAPTLHTPDDEPVRSELAFCTTARGPDLPDDPDGRWYEVHRVAYRVVNGPGGEGFLVRENQPQAGPGALLPARTNVLLGATGVFRVELFDGEVWRARWPPEGKKAVPRAARITLGRASADPPLTTEVLIPAGHPVRPGG